MNIPEGFKLVPVETTDQMNESGCQAYMAADGSAWVMHKSSMEAAYKAMLETAPTPPQPIYDDSKERELFEAYCAKVGLPVDTLPSGEYLIPATRFMSQGWHARAKAGEVGHE